MQFNPSPTELTTSATDVVLGALCLVLLVSLVKLRVNAPVKKAIWESVFALLVLSSVLGALAHGFDFSDSVRSALWQPLYLSLGLAVALFLVGGLADWRGEPMARRLVPWAIGLGVAFFAVTHVSNGGFGIFVAYEAAATAATLAIYAFLWRSRGVPGTGLVTAGIAITLAAAVVQRSHLRVQIIWSFDHNGVFHLVQVVAVVTMARGLRVVLGGSAPPLGDGNRDETGRR